MAMVSFAFDQAFLVKPYW